MVQRKTVGSNGIRCPDLPWHHSRPGQLSRIVPGLEHCKVYLVRFGPHWHYSRWDWHYTGPHWHCSEHHITHTTYTGFSQFLGIFGVFEIFLGNWTFDFFIYQGFQGSFRFFAFLGFMGLSRILAIFWNFRNYGILRDFWNIWDMPKRISLLKIPNGIRIF